MAYPTVTQHSKLYPYTSVMASPYSCDPTGSLDIASAIEQLKANQSNIGTIYFPHGTWKLSTALTIPSGMSVVFEAGATINVGANFTVNGRLVFIQGGLLNIATGVTVTINGTLEAGFYQIFSCTGTGKVELGDGSATVLYPEFWGASPDGATDCSTAFSAWLTACISSGIKGELANGTYKVNSEVAATMAAGKSLTIEGQGGGSIIDMSDIPYNTGYGATEVDGITITGTPSTDPNNVVRLSKFRMIGGATDLGGLSGIKIDSTGKTILDGVIATDFPMIGIWLKDVLDFELRGCSSLRNYYANVLAGDNAGTCRGARVFGGEYNEAGNGAGPNYGGDSSKGIGYGLVLDAQQVAVVGARVVSNDRYGIDFRAGSDVVINSCYIYNSGLEGIHGKNYQIYTGGGINIKVVNNTIDNNDRAGSSNGMELGSYENPAATNWGTVDSILVDNNTIKRTLASAIFVHAHKLIDGVTTSVKKLIITNNQIEHTDGTEAYARYLVCAGSYSPISQYIDNSVIANNIIINGGIYHGLGKNAKIHGNALTFTGAPASNELIRSYADNSWINNNSMGTPSDLTVNPLLHVAGVGEYSGLSKIREMFGNTNNGKHLPNIWNWRYNGSEMEFMWEASTGTINDRALVKLVFSGATKKTILWDVLYSCPAGTDAAPTLAAGRLLEHTTITDAGVVAFGGASPYTLTPITEKTLGGGAMQWKMYSGANEAGLYTSDNALVQAYIKLLYTGTISTIDIKDWDTGVTYVE